ncbi:hypothetical protein B296_00000671 [Ensete ventricosum]|uniref:Uncharacterized protein n=1 Tax=Ensete ventricosum TaxID=4639 RepID=A0A426XPP2_ENSVE|nr:hypothetical protein B296_00000671 [Ensete ventricosum]
MLNRSKLLPFVARPDCFLQPHKVKDKRVVQEMIETWIVRPCLFPTTTHPYILFPGDKLLLKCYIPSNSPWLLISGDFHDFPQDRTMMLKDIPNDDLGSTTYDRKKEQEKGIQMTPVAMMPSISMLALSERGNVFVLGADISRVGIGITLMQDGRKRIAAAPFTGLVDQGFPLLRSAIEPT